MMTTKQAIHLLHRLQDEQFDGIHGDERREALSMAVRALESNLVKESGDLVNDLVKDCISRQAAIDLLKQMRKDGDMIPWEGKDVFARIRKLPSAQPELIEQGAYVRGFEQGRTQGMIDAKEGKK